MLRFELLRDRRILLIKPEGPLQRADFERLAKEIDPFIAANGKLVGVMIHAESFPQVAKLGRKCTLERFGIRRGELVFLEQNFLAKAARCTKVFQEKISGARSDRKQLARLMAVLAKGTCWSSPALTDWQGPHAISVISWERSGKTALASNS